MVAVSARLLLHPMTSLGQKPFHDMNGNGKRKILKSSKGRKPLAPVLVTKGKGGKPALRR